MQKNQTIKQFIEEVTVVEPDVHDALEYAHLNVRMTQAVWEMASNALREYNESYNCNTTSLSTFAKEKADAYDQAMHALENNGAPKSTIIRYRQAWWTMYVMANWIDKHTQTHIKLIEIFPDGDDSYGDSDLADKKRDRAPSKRKKKPASITRGMGL